MESNENMKEKEVKWVSNEDFEDFITTIKTIVDMKIQLWARMLSTDESYVMSHEVIVTDTKGGIGFVTGIEKLEVMDDTYEIHMNNSFGIPSEIVVSKEDLCIDSQGVVIQTYKEHTVSFDIKEILSIGNINYPKD